MYLGLCKDQDSKLQLLMWLTLELIKRVNWIRSFLKDQLLIWIECLYPSEGLFVGERKGTFIQDRESLCLV